MPLADWQIRQLAEENNLISPYNPARLSSAGYDLSLDCVFKIPNPYADEQIIDPFNPPEFETKRSSDYIIIPPHGFVLGCTIEALVMPIDLIGICVGRSTYARSAIISHVTPIEPGWSGYVTIEISNTNPLPVKVWVNEGITQIVFFKLDEEPELDYLSKGGRYQNQQHYPVQGKPRNA